MDASGLVSARALAKPYDWDMVVATESTRYHTLQDWILYRAKAMFEFLIQNRRLGGIIIYLPPSYESIRYITGGPELTTRSRFRSGFRKFLCWSFKGLWVFYCNTLNKRSFKSEAMR